LLYHVKGHLKLILFSGRLVVDEEAMILDTTSTIDSTEGELFMSCMINIAYLLIINKFPNMSKMLLSL